MALTRDVVLRAALKLLDKVGLDALTMRRLAADVGVQPGALYWHFADKQALHDAMAEAMLQEYAEPPPTGSWEEKLGELARRLLKAMTRHRDGVRVVSQMITPGPGALAIAELMLRILAEGGLRGRAGLWASAVVGSYVTGFSLDVEGMQEMQVSGLASMIRTMKRTLDPARYPNLLGVADQAETMMQPRAVEERFEFGLRIVLNGLRSAAHPQRRAGRRASTPALRRH